MARPHKPTNEVLSTQVTIRVNNDIFLQLNDIAAAEQRTLASLIRILMEQEIARQQIALKNNYKLEFQEAG
jgi:predicted transcriptional regulator